MTCVIACHNGTWLYHFQVRINKCFSIQSINQSNPVLLKERVRIPRTCRAGGAAMLWGALPLEGVGSCRLFFTDDLHDTLSWVPASDKPHTFQHTCIWIHIGTNDHSIWVRSRNCGCLVTWFCYQLIAKPGNKTATVSWPDPYIFSK